MPQPTIISPFTVDTHLTENFRVINKVQAKKGVFTSIQNSCDDTIGLVYLGWNSKLYFAYVDAKSKSGWTNLCLADYSGTGGSTWTQMSGRSITIKTYVYNNIIYVAVMGLDNLYPPGAVYDLCSISKSEEGEFTFAYQATNGLPFNPDATLFVAKNANITNGTSGGSEVTDCLIVPTAKYSNTSTAYFGYMFYNFYGLSLNTGPRFYNDINPDPWQGPNVIETYSVSGFAGVFHSFLFPNEYMLSGLNAFNSFTNAEQGVQLQPPLLNEDDELIGGVLLNSHAGRQVLITFTNKNICTSTFDETAKTWSSAQALDCTLPPGITSISHVRAKEFINQRDKTTHLHIFITDQNNNLYHFSGPEAGSITGYSEGELIFTSAQQIELATNTSGQLNLFVVDKANYIIRFWQDEHTDHWNADYVEMPIDNLNEGVLEKIKSYTCNFVVRDQNGINLPNTEVEIHCTEAVNVHINNQLVFIPLQGHTYVKTNKLGQLNLVYETTGTYIPSFQLQISARSPLFNIENASALFYEPFEVVKSFFLDSTPDQLANNIANQRSQDPATLNQYLVSGEYRNNPSQMITPVMQAAQDLAKMLDEGTPGTKVVAGSTPDMTMLTKKLNKANIKPRAWVLENRPSGPEFTAYTVESAPPVQDSEIEIGADLFWEVNTGLASLTKLILIADTAATDKTEPKIIIQLEIVNETNNPETRTIAITCIDEIMDALQCALGSIPCAMPVIYADLQETGTLRSRRNIATEILDYLGFIFDWESIRLTHTAIYNTFYSSMKSLSSQSGSIKTAILSILELAKTNINSNLDDIHNELSSILGLNNSGSTSLNTIVGSSQPNPTISQQPSVKNNLLMNIFTDDKSQKALSNITLSSSPSQDIFSEIENLITQKNFSSLDCFVKAKKDIVSIVNNPAQLGSFALDFIFEILQGTIDLTIELVEDLVELIMDLFSVAIETLLEMFTQEWDIFFISYIYNHHVLDSSCKNYTDGTSIELCGLSLVSLIAAFPITVIYKITTSTAPFSSEQDIINFINYNARKVNHPSRLIEGVALETNAANSSPKANMDLSNSIINGIFTIFNCVFDAICDLEDPTIPDNGKIDPVSLAVQALGNFCQWVRFFQELPSPYGYYNNNGSPRLPDFNNSEDIARLISYLTIPVLAIDTFLIGHSFWRYETGITLEKMENFQLKFEGDPGTIYSAITGAMFLGLDLWYSIKGGIEIADVSPPAKKALLESANVVNGVAYVLDDVTDICRLMRLKAVVNPDKLSLPIMASIDVVFSVCSGAALITAGVFEYKASKYED